LSWCVNVCGGCSLVVLFSLCLLLSCVFLHLSPWRQVKLVFATPRVPRGVLFYPTERFLPPTGSLLVLCALRRCATRALLCASAQRATRWRRFTLTSFRRRSARGLSRCWGRRPSALAGACACCPAVAPTHHALPPQPPTRHVAADVLCLRGAARVAEISAPLHGGVSPVVVGASWGVAGGVWRGDGRGRAGDAGLQHLLLCVSAGGASGGGGCAGEKAQQDGAGAPSHPHLTPHTHFSTELHKHTAHDVPFWCLVACVCVLCARVVFFFLFVSFLCTHEIV